ncbi:MAG TPA: hypothetical protein VK988_18840 [Acidimicrobiales bacterium]|nr:hypothetical protein [Acidimicrobiales bacterium]
MSESLPKIRRGARDGQAKVERHAVEPSRLVRQFLDRHQEAELVTSLPPLESDAGHRRHRELTTA